MSYVFCALLCDICRCDTYKACLVVECFDETRLIRSYDLPFRRISSFLGLGGGDPLVKQCRGLA